MPEPLFEEGDFQIPDKMFFRVGEVSRLVGVPAHVLRYWETEFPALAPRKSGRGHRLYRRQDVELLFQIKDLLHVRRFTIEGARKYLKQHRSARRTAARPRQAELFEASTAPQLAAIREELRQILDLLK
jgi:DNA-binding transcriptional MerR regulator